ncbi:3585_t:CDS:2, partial [Cetraspora pellucida]
LEIYEDEDDMHKKIDLYKPMQTSGVLEKFDFASDKIKQVQELLRIRYHDAKDNLPTTSELDEYLAVSQILFDSDPFTWWNINKKRFPIISKLARMYLSVSVTFTPSERLFFDCANKHTIRVIIKARLVLMLG